MGPARELRLFNFCLSIICLFKMQEQHVYCCAPESAQKFVPSCRERHISDPLEPLWLQFHCKPTGSKGLFSECDLANSSVSLCSFLAPKVKTVKTKTSMQTNFFNNPTDRSAVALKTDAACKNTLQFLLKSLNVKIEASPNWRGLSELGLLWLYWGLPLK